MDFKAIRVISAAVAGLMKEIPWAPYGPQSFQTPVINTEEDCAKVDLLLDMMGTLTRLMDTRINFVTTDGKVVREWIESILGLADRYRTVLELLNASPEIVRKDNGPR